MANPNPPAPRRHFIREWRKSVPNLTLARLADRVGIAQSSLSRIERGEQPYSQPILEALAEAIGCEPADLIGRLPGAPRELTLLVNRIPPEDVEIAKRFLEKLARVA